MFVGGSCQWVLFSIFVFSGRGRSSIDNVLDDLLASDTEDGNAFNAFLFSNFRSNFWFK